MSSRPRPKRSLGQNFLVDRRIPYRIASAAGLSADDVVVEVGAGRGILTRELAARAGRVVAIEIDEDVAAELDRELGHRENVEVCVGDARDVDLASLVPQTTPYKLVGNLPYYAATPIVRRFLGVEHKPKLLVIMVQKEVAQNMVAAPGKMSLLSVAVQLYGKPKLLFSVPPRAFRPIPKVTSAVVRIDVLERPAVDFESEEHFFTLVKAGFSAPRKQIHNCLKRGLDMPADEVAAMLDEAGVDPKRRPGTVSLPEWGLLYREFGKLRPADVLHEC